MLDHPWLLDASNVIPKPVQSQSLAQSLFLLKHGHDLSKTSVDKLLLSLQLLKIDSAHAQEIESAYDNSDYI